MDLLPFFQWLDGSWLASLAKANGGVFATVQMVHLVSLAVLGGMVLVLDLRLLGVTLNDIPVERLMYYTHRWFDAALVALVATGVFMSAAVAMKLYYNEMFWAKMSALIVGVVFVYAIERPLLRQGGLVLQTATLRLLALSSLAVWFTVAAAGRWIGFS